MQHSLCNAHLLRELNYFGETMEGHQWPIQLKQILIDAKVAVKSAQTSGETQISPDKLTELERRYDEWVGIGLMLFPKKTPPAGGKGKVKQLPATNLLLRLHDFKTEALRFLSDFAVPFDNNLAERLIRPVKVKLKVAGGFRAFGGAEAFCVIRSIWETAKLNGKNPFDSLRQAFA